MLAELSAAVSCVTAIKDLAKTLQAGPSDAQWREHITALVDNIIDLQSRMLAVQSEYQQLSELNQGLKQQIADHEQWEQTAANYELREIVDGMFVYVVKDECRGNEPTHWLCPNCFQKQRKSIISKVCVDHINRKCHNCGLEISPVSSYS